MEQNHPSHRIDFAKQITLQGTFMAKSINELIPHRTNEDDQIGLLKLFEISPVECGRTEFYFNNDESKELREFLCVEKQSHKAWETLQSIAEDNEGRPLLHMWFDDFLNANPFSQSNIFVIKGESIIRKLYLLTEAWKKIGVTKLSIEFYKKER